MSEALDLIDEFIYHAHMQERFKTAQANKALRYMRKLNRAIAGYLGRKKTLETKADYRRASAKVRELTKAFEKQLLEIIEKDIRGQFRAEKEWLAGTLPETGNAPAENTVVNKVLFNSFNGVDTVEAYIKGLSLRIFRIWDSQMRIAVTTGAGLDRVTEQVLGGK